MVGNAAPQLTWSVAHVNVFTKTKVQTKNKHTRTANIVTRLVYLLIITRPQPLEFSSCIHETKLFYVRECWIICVWRKSKLVGWQTSLITFTVEPCGEINITYRFAVCFVNAYSVGESNSTNVMSFSANVIAKSILCNFIWKQVVFCDAKKMYMIADNCKKSSPLVY